MCAIFSEKGQKRGRKSWKGHKWAKYLKIWVKMYNILKKGRWVLEIITHKKTARIGPDDHPAINRDVDLFITCTLSIFKLPEYTQVEFFFCQKIR